MISRPGPDLNTPQADLKFLGCHCIVTVQVTVPGPGHPLAAWGPSESLPSSSTIIRQEKREGSFASCVRMSGSTKDLFCSRPGTRTSSRTQTGRDAGGASTCSPCSPCNPPHCQCQRKDTDPLYPTPFGYLTVVCSWSALHRRRRAATSASITAPDERALSCVV